MANQFDKQFEGEFDADFCMALTDEYQKSGDREILKLLVTQVAPLVGIVSKTHITKFTLKEDLSVLHSEALVAVYYLFLDKTVPTEDVEEYSKFLYTKIRWSLLDSIRRSKEQTFDLWKGGDAPIEQENPLNELHDRTEHTIYLSQFKKLLLEVTTADIRFSGKEKLACEYIASCLLGYKPHDPMSVKFRFKLSKPTAERLVQYMTTLLKDTAYDLRKV